MAEFIFLALILLGSIECLRAVCGCKWPYHRQFHSAQGRQLAFVTCALWFALILGCIAVRKFTPPQFEPVVLCLTVVGFASTWPLIKRLRAAELSPFPYTGDDCE